MHFLLDALVDWWCQLNWNLELGLVSIITNLIATLAQGFLWFQKISDLPFFKNLYHFFIQLLWLFLPIKLVLELMLHAIRDELDQINIDKKLLGGVLAVILSYTTYQIYPYLQNQIEKISDVLVNDKTKHSLKLADEVFVTTLSSLGGMDYKHASYLVKCANNDWNGKYLLNKKLPQKICSKCQKRYWNLDLKDDEFHITQHIYINRKRVGFLWKHNQFLTILGLGLFSFYFLLLSLRFISKALIQLLFYLLTPLCALSLTNYYEPISFIFWKNGLKATLISSFFQILMVKVLLQLMLYINGIHLSNHFDSYLKILMMFSSLSFVVGSDNYIQSAFGLELNLHSSMQQVYMHSRQILGMGLNQGGNALYLGGKALTKIHPYQSYQDWKKLKDNLSYLKNHPDEAKGFMSGGEFASKMDHSGKIIGKSLMNMGDHLKRFSRHFKGGIY